MSKHAKPRLTFTDCENSGLFGNPSSLDECIALDRQVVEYAFILWEDGDRKETFVKRVMPTGDAVQDALDLAAQGFNHFKLDWWKKVAEREYGRATPWDASDCEAVDHFLEGETIAGSNPGFDLIQFKKEFHCFGVGHLFPKLATHRMCDVGALAWPPWAAGLTEKTGLEALCKLLGVKFEAHTALGDCAACIDCFEILIDSYIYRPRQMAELLRELGADLNVGGIVEAEIAKLRGVAL